MILDQEFRETVSLIINLRPQSCSWLLYSKKYLLSLLKYLSILTRQKTQHIYLQLRNSKRSLFLIINSLIIRMRPDGMHAKYV